MTTKITESAAIAVSRYLPRVSVDDAHDALNAALPYLTTEPDVPPITDQLTRANSRMMWAALAYTEAVRNGLEPVVVQRLMDQYTETREAWAALDE